MSSHELNLLANFAGSESCSIFKDLFDHALTSHTYTCSHFNNKWDFDWKTDTYRHLYNLYARGLVDKYARSPLEDLIYWADRDWDDTFEDRIRAACNKLLQQECPTSRAIANIVLCWGLHAQWYEVLVSVMGSDFVGLPFQDLLYDCDRLERIPFFLRAAIMGASNAPSDPLLAVKGMISEVPLQFIYHDGGRWILKRRCVWINETIRRVAEIGNGFYTQSLLSRFDPEEIRSVKALAAEEVNEDIDNYLASPKAWNMSPRSNAAYVQACNLEGDLILTYSRGDVDELLDGLYYAIAQPEDIEFNDFEENLNNNETTVDIILNTLNIYHYPFDLYWLYAGACNRQLQSILRQWDNCEWHSETMTVAASKGPVLEIKNGADCEEEFIRVIDEQLAKILITNGLSVGYTNGRLLFPKDENAFQKFNDLIVSALTQIRNTPIDDHLVIPPQ